MPYQRTPGAPVVIAEPAIADLTDSTTGVVSATLAEADRDPTGVGAVSIATLRAVFVTLDANIASLAAKQVEILEALRAHDLIEES